MKDRNFGFIRDSDTNIDHFFHREDFEGTWEYISEGAKVSFEYVTSPKGPRAGNVQLRQP